MFPRQLAMDAAVAEMQAENKESISSDLADHIRIWLESLKLYSPDLAIVAHVVTDRDVGSALSETIKR